MILNYTKSNSHPFHFQDFEFGTFKIESLNSNKMFHLTFRQRWFLRMGKQSKTYSQNAYGLELDLLV